MLFIVTGSANVARAEHNTPYYIEEPYLSIEEVHETDSTSSTTKGVTSTKVKSGKGPQVGSSSIGSRRSNQTLLVVLTLLLSLLFL